jgi:molybdopterin-synthase adenylyltransferase
MHSHPGPGWQGMSQDDVAAEVGHAAPTKGATGFPLVGLTLGTDGAWSARFWVKTGRRTYQRQWCEAVRVVGQRMAVTYMDELIPPPKLRPELTRTVSAWGPKAQAHLARLRIGVIGAGSVGSIVAEALARIGLQRIALMDFDDVEIVNLDRLLHATRRDALLKRAKVDVIARGIQRGATAADFAVDAWELSITEEDGFRAALDCDILFCCVDRPWPRSVLNLIAYAHLIPVIDGGISVETNKAGNALKRADWRAHVVSPGRKCLECLGQYDPGLVSAERDGYVDDPVYIAGLPKDHQLRRNENVFAFSLSTASFEVLQMLSMVVAPLGLSNPGAQMYHFVTGNLDVDRSECSPNCIYCSLVARGDASGIGVTSTHARAIAARQQREQIRKTWRYRLATLAERILLLVERWTEPPSH